MTGNFRKLDHGVAATPRLDSSRNRRLGRGASCNNEECDPRQAVVRATSLLGQPKRRTVPVKLSMVVSRVDRPADLRQERKEEKLTVL